MYKKILTDPEHCLSPLHLASLRPKNGSFAYQLALRVEPLNRNTRRESGFEPGRAWTRPTPNI